MILAIALAPLPSLALALRQEVVLLSEDGKEVRRVPLVARRLIWSPDGRTLAALDRDGGLWTVKGEKDAVRVAEEASEPVWGADGRLLFTSGAKGIAAIGGESSPNLLVPMAHSPAPSPDAARLAFAADGPEGGVWVAAADGSHARRLVKGTRVGGVSWSYDGRWLGGVVDGHLRLVRSNGMAGRDLGPITGTTAVWSNGTPEILARRGKAWSVYDDLRDEWRDLEFEPLPEPHWTGPHRLMGVRGKDVVESTLGGRTERISTEAAVDATRAVGLYRGVSFPDPFRGAPRPPMDGTAWRGQIVSFDPVDGTLIASVESEIDPRGRETTLAHPVIRRAKASAGSLSHRLAVVPETDAWLVVVRGRILDAFLPDFPASNPSNAPSPAAPASPLPGRPARPFRPARAVEYDGVCRDHVVVSMIYPLPGKHHAGDSFLNDRDGGSRRHHGNDLMSPKMTPLLAAFDGIVRFGRTDATGASNMLTLEGDNGYTAWYLHINNDTPGTDDGRGSLRYAFPADLQSGDRVRAGQLVAWCGDSGNAENTAPHLHFELHDEGAVLDPYYSLQSAQHIAAPRYADPDPALTTKAGETRWDGVVTTVDPAKGVLVLELTGVETPNHPPKRCLVPRLVYLSLAAGQTLRYRNSDDLAYPIDALHPGAYVSAAGIAVGSKMAVRSASMALSSG